jgi:hypothetical protein
MTRLHAALAVLLLLQGCSAIPTGGDPALDLADLKTTGRPTLGRLAIAPIATISLAADEVAKGWDAPEVFDFQDLRVAMKRGLESTGSFDDVRAAASGSLGEAWDSGDD